MFCRDLQQNLRWSGHDLRLASPDGLSTRLSVFGLHSRGGRNRPLTRRSALWQYRAMLGEPENQFSLTRAALGTCARQKAISYQYQYRLSVYQ